MQFDPTTMVLILGVIALFYVMLIRPQQKRAKEQQKLMDSLQPGDRVMTVSGIFGTVRHLGEKQAVLEISPGVEMTVVKAALSTQSVDDEFEYGDADDAEPTDTEPTDAELAEAELHDSETKNEESAAEEPAAEELTDDAATGANNAADPAEPNK
jgi:preprotein translocase subunit YajC